MRDLVKLYKQALIDQALAEEIVFNLKTEIHESLPGEGVYTLFSDDTGETLQVSLDQGWLDIRVPDKTLTNK